MAGCAVLKMEVKCMLVHKVECMWMLDMNDVWMCEVDKFEAEYILNMEVMQHESE